MEHRWVSRAAAGLVTIVALVAAASGANGARSSAAAVPSAAGFDVFFNDEDESTGSVYRYRPSTGAVDTVYTRSSGRIGSFSTYFYPSKIYFVTGSNANVYRVDYVSGQWQTEQVVFTHQTYVRDIAFLPDAGGSPRLYFSQASGAGADGWIFKEDYGKAVQVYRVRLSEVDGYWGGDFAFDDQGRLYLSTGNRSPARLYRVDSGTPTVIYGPSSGTIGGFFGLPDVAYYAGNDTSIYRVDTGDGSRTIVHDSSVHGRITDVQTIGDEPVPPTPVPTTTATRVPTKVPSATPTPTIVPSSTPTPTATVVPSSTPTPTATDVPPLTVTATHTGQPSAVPSASPTASPTVVPTSSATPTATTVASPVPTATVTPSNQGELAGTVRLDGRADHSGVSLYVDGELGSWTSDAGGHFTIGPLDPGARTVDVRYAGYLRAGTRTFTVEVGRTLSLPAVTLLGGDANRDDRIDIVDGAIVGSTFGLGVEDGGFDRRGDINGDSVVDIFDLVSVGNNFGCRLSDETGRCRRWADR